MFFRPAPKFPGAVWSDSVAAMMDLLSESPRQFETGSDHGDYVAVHCDVRSQLPGHVRER